MKYPQCGKLVEGGAYHYSCGAVRTYFCGMSCADAYRGNEEPHMKCDRCRIPIGRNDPLHQGFSETLCGECYMRSYQEKENEMEYRGHIIEAKMVITLPTGAKHTYDLPSSLVRNDAVEKIDKMIPVAKCRRCGVVIEGGSLCVDSRYAGQQYCSIACYEHMNRTDSVIPQLKRLEGD